MSYLSGTLSIGLMTFPLLEPVPETSLISSPQMTLHLIPSDTDLTMYHLVPRFMYSGESEILVRGDIRSVFRLVIVWKTILEEMLSFIIGNWLHHDWSVSYSYRYMTMSFGRFFSSSHSS